MQKWIPLDSNSCFIHKNKQMAARSRVKGPLFQVFYEKKEVFIQTLKNLFTYLDIGFILVYNILT
ncbi:hypothetical protein J43TS9_05850 [Paenibacillus cineris]|nr:hypothetical protein J43TS9_05850 [Paenibacillus cineris]